MANIIFTDTGRSIEITFGDKKSNYGCIGMDVPENSTPLIIEEDDVMLSFFSNGQKISIDYHDVDVPADSTSATDLESKLSSFFFFR